jgi:SNF2 family DNA or RNA helicase
MKVETHRHAIILSDLQPDEFELAALIPGSHKLPREYAFTLPASPFTAVRLWARFKNQPFTRDQGFNDLLDEWKEIKLAAQYKDVAQVANFPDYFQTRTKPWKHQIAAYNFIRHLRSAYLAMEMGTGKTLVAINKVIESDYKRVLILCPKSVIEVWQDELLIHCPENYAMNLVILNKGSTDKKMEKASFVYDVTGDGRLPYIVVCNYESAWRGELGDFLLSINWDLTILDEAHKIKAANGKASKWCKKLGKHTENKLCLSGTPLPNDLRDAYGQYRFLDPGVFGTSVTAFRSRYTKPSAYSPHVIEEWINQDEFNRLFSYLMFRVDKDVLDLPGETDVYRTFDMNRAAREVYTDLEKHFISDTQHGVVSAANVLTRMVRFQQITSGFCKTEDNELKHLDSGKANLLEETLQDIGDEKVLIFARYTEDLNVIRGVCEDVGKRVGEVSGRHHDTERGKFPKDKDVLIAQIDAGAEGLNLVAARYSIFYSPNFSLRAYDQARSRVHRGGQNKHVTHIHLLASNTIDNVIYKALNDKKEIIDAILNYVKAA